MSGLVCDKCHQPVNQDNDAALLDAIALDNPLYALATPRHLLPVMDEDGVVLCEGSPSRAQYLPNQPRDTRGYEWDEDLATKITDAYAKMIEMVGI